MIKEISKIFYIWFFVSLIFTFFISIFFKISLIWWNSSLLFLILVWIIPFVEKVINFIKKDSKQKYFWFKDNENLFKYLCLIIFFITCILSWKINVLELSILTIIIFSLIFKVDERYFFLSSLIFLTFVVLNLILENKEIAENFSIYTYYWLVLWVISSLYNSTWKEELEEKNIKYVDKNKNLLNFEIEKYFLYYLIITLILLFNKNFEYVNYISIIFFIIYFIWNFFWWHKINLEYNEKIDKNNEKKFIIISWIMWNIIFILLVWNKINNLYIYTIFLFLMIILINFIYKKYSKKIFT